MAKVLQHYKQYNKPIHFTDNIGVWQSYHPTNINIEPAATGLMKFRQS